MSLYPLTVRLVQDIHYDAVTRWVNSLLLVIIAFFVMIDGYAISDYLLYQEWYRFDGSSGGWRYASRYSFFATLTLEIVLAFTGLVAGVLARNDVMAMLFRFGIVTILGAMALRSMMG